MDNILFNYLVIILPFVWGFSPFMDNILFNYLVIIMIAVYELIYIKLTENIKRHIKEKSI